MQGENTFDLLRGPLDGRNLIEASAGTGKTYAITCLYLRLVLEKDLSPGEILAVTFTEAATQDLKDRIRKKLREAVEVFKSGRSEDEFLKGLAVSLEDPVGAAERLEGVLQDFDEAAVYTIHGFCARVLYENAVESGSLFDTELVTDEDEIKMAVVEDFWRRHLYGASALFVSYVVGMGLSPERLHSYLSHITGRPYVRVIPDSEDVDPSGQERSFRETFERVRETWASSRDDVINILKGDNGLSRVRYKPSKIPLWAGAMDRFLDSKGNSLEIFPDFEKFTASGIQRSLKKDSLPPSHPFFDICEELISCRDALEKLYRKKLLGINASLFKFAVNEMRKIKADRNIHSFDDLLLKVHGALKKGPDDGLAKAVRKKYRAVLIDEFQDTDPIQYEIFRDVFGNVNTPVFFIGDPKQAIYGFRGADLFAYMDAAGNVGSRFTLLENWRSEPGLIEAVNAIFSFRNRPFVYEEIPFYRGFAAERKDAESLLIKPEDEPPFHLWLMEAERYTGSDKAVTKGDARAHIQRAVAAEISRLVLLGKRAQALLGDRPLREGDIAVLVRTNSEGRNMREALNAFGIPAVLYRTGNLFLSREALEMETALWGICEPHNETFIKAALSTDMMGVKGEEIAGLGEDDNRWEEWLARFRYYYELWKSRSFIRMFSDFLSREEILPRLMSFDDGERRGTNVLHLAEVLHRASLEKRLGIYGLLKWLNEKRTSSIESSEEYQLRLETDENAVQIVTIHKSKGLEYPVVFCPFAWDGLRAGNDRKPFTFHDESDGLKLKLDLGSEEVNENLASARREELSENLRLLYVALTRAKARCYLVWGRIRGAETSAQAYLFHGPESCDKGEEVTCTARRYNEMNDGRVKEDLAKLPAASGGSIRISPLPVRTGEFHPPAVEEEEKLARRLFSGEIDRFWKVASFSSLTSDGQHVFETADRDGIMDEDSDRQEEESGPGEPEPVRNIYTFPKGARAGTFFHDILEHLDFRGEREPGLDRLVTEKLHEYGFRPEWHEPVCNTIRILIDTPMGEGREDLRLSKIGDEERMNELEFYFPLKKITPDRLNLVFRERPGLEVPPGFLPPDRKLTFMPVKGFMKGFIDMVFRWKGRFYMVDWKSNYLGDRPEDYEQGPLLGAMMRYSYFLQYHIYSLALDQYLGLRIPDYSYERHFGGVFYVFLRGLNGKNGTGRGIFRDLPAPELMNALREVLLENRRHN